MFVCQKGSTNSQPRPRTRSIQILNLTSIPTPVQISTPPNPLSISNSSVIRRVVHNYASHDLSVIDFPSYDAMTETTNATSLGSTVELDAAAEVLSTLPPTSFAFAYGSAIFPQSGISDRSQRMIDLIVAVDDPQSWHAHNMSMNRWHYSAPIRMLGPTAAVSLQRSDFGARVYYNTILSPRPFKYGVVSVADLTRDLTQWESLYISGRMQKPIRVLSDEPPVGLATAMESNISSAAAAALLSLPERFREDDLYTAVAALSYRGDVRMRFAVEVRSKVSDIVRANLERFRALYKPVACDCGHAHARSDGVWSREVEATGQARLLRRLPHHIRETARRRLGVRDANGGVDALARLDNAAVGSAVVGAVAAVVARSSIRQSLKGLATAGLGTSARYVASKLGKSVRARVFSGSKRMLSQIPQL